MKPLGEMCEPMKGICVQNNSWLTCVHVAGKRIFIFALSPNVVVTVFVFQIYLRKYNYTCSLFGQGGFTALIFASVLGFEELVDVLLAAGANKDLQSTVRYVSRLFCFFVSKYYCICRSPLIASLSGVRCAQLGRQPARHEYLAIIWCVLLPDVVFEPCLHSRRP